MIALQVNKLYKNKTNPFELSIHIEIPDQYKKIVFFGPSGSGKTQTLHCLAGLTIPDSGKILLNDTVLYESEKTICLPAQKRQIGYMFQDYALFPHLTILQNVAYAETDFFPFFLSNAVRMRAEELLDRFHLSHLSKRYPGELSGGQRQRVALIRALNASPRLLLLDEPFSALDPLLRGQLRQELANIIQTLSIPTIFITHDPDDVEMFADMLILYNSGHAKCLENYTERRKAFSSATECLLALQAEAFP